MAVLELARLLANLKQRANPRRGETSTPGTPGKRPAVDLPVLFARIKAKAPNASWSVAELRRWGFIEPDDAHRLGQDLARLARDGGRIGPFELQRLGRDNEGAVWQLR